VRGRDMEDFAYILDYLPQGHPQRGFKREGLALALGEDEFKLFELIPKPDAELTVGERVYVGKDIENRLKILHVKRRIGYNDLTNAAQSELPYVIQEIVKQKEEKFIRFYNEAQSITTRFHMLELLPGLGKKSMWTIIDERKKEKFSSFKDIDERVSSIHHPAKLIAQRIETELINSKEKYHIFVAK